MTSEANPINLADYERLAAVRLSPGALGYYAGGAGDENTLRANCAAWSEFELRPRVCVDVSSVSTAAQILGEQLSMPILIAPTALQRMAHPDGEPAMARAAQAAGTLMVCSMLASSTQAEIAAAAPGAPRWVQLYLCRDRAISYALVDEAAAVGATAVVVTVDAPRAGLRELDLRTAFTVPDGIEMPGVNAVLGRSASLTVQQFFELVDPALDWDGLAEFISSSQLPVIVKGVQCGEDAVLAQANGAAAVIVSNHGGRQLDNVAPTARLLPEVVEALAGSIEVLVDGGIRRGTDVAAALALGADAVLVGRPALWGLAADGEAGAAHLLELLRSEFELALALLGVCTPAQLTAEHVRRCGR